jgi:hypothetical protein
MMPENKKLINVVGGDVMQAREEWIASMGPKTRKIHDKIEKILLQESSSIVKNRWRIGTYVISLQDFAKDQGEPHAVEKVAGALGVGSQLRHFKRIVEAYPTEEDIDAVCALRDSSNRPIGYSKLFLLCAKEITAKERKTLLITCKDSDVTVNGLKSQIYDLLSVSGRKDSSGKDYQMSEGGRKPKLGTVVAPRSMSAAGRKLTTMCAKFLEAKEGIDEAYDKFFEEGDADDSVRHIEMLEETRSHLELTAAVCADLIARTDTALGELADTRARQQAEDRTLEVPSKPQKAKRQKLQVSESRREAISRAKSQSEAGAPPF